MTLEPMDPEEAARCFEHEPDTLCWPLMELMTQFGFTEADLMGELRSGRLVAHGTPTADGGFDDVAVTGAALRAWLANKDVPSRVRRSVLRFLERRGPRQ